MSDYNSIRRRELEHIEESIKSDAGYKGRLTRLYDKTETDIRRAINADMDSFAYRDRVSMAEARKIVSKTDVRAFQDTAKQYVKEKNFSPQANRELRAYNVTLRTNRLELLQARINLATVELANEENRLLTSHLQKEMMKEYTRQAGILNMSVPSTKQIERLLKSTMLSDVSGITFSDRIWANQNELRDEVNNAIRRSVIRGEHPRTTARELGRLVSDEFENKKYAADRIAITESARAQSISTEESFKDAGINQYMWIAEPDACDECAELDGEVFKIGGGNPMPPEPHPFCRCSISSYVD